MSAKHTPGPWVVRRAPDLYIYIGAAHGVELARMSSDNMLVEGFTEANALRIAACVNACEGVPTSWLNAQCDPELNALFGPLAPLHERMLAALEDAERIRKQRDALLAALKSFLRAPSVGSAGPGSSTIAVQDFNLRAAQAAVAQAEAHPAATIGSGRMVAAAS